jgi:hypothetical protein
MIVIRDIQDGRTADAGFASQDNSVMFQAKSPLLEGLPPIVGQVEEVCQEES